MSDTLFSISCTTCQARLKVQSESAIGQILMCPKCDSMVQVLPPPNWRETNEVGKAAGAAAATLAPQEPAAPQTASISPAKAVTDAAPIAPPHDPHAVPPPPPQHRGPPLPPSDGWSSPAEQLWQKVILWSAGGGIAVFAMGALAGYLLSGGEQEPSTPAAIASREEPSDTQRAAADNETTTTKTTTTKLDTDHQSVARPEEVHRPNPRQETTKAAQSTEPQAAVNSAAKADEPPLGAADKTSPPLESPEPEKNSDASAVPTAATNDANPSQVDDKILPPQTTVVHAPKEGGLGNEDDLSVRLAEKVPGIRLHEARLVDVVDLLTELTMAPITMDLAAMEAAQLPLDVRVSVALENASVAEVLTAVLSPIGLTYLADEGHVIITSRAMADASPRRIKFPIDDLVKADALPAFAELLQRLAAPGSWQSAGGLGTVHIDGNNLVVEQSRPIIDELVVLTEKLRVARGLPLRSRYSPERFRLATRDSQAAERLSQPAGFTFHEPTRLTEVARFLQKTTGMNIRFDWRSLAKEGLGPRTEISSTVPQQPLDEALTTLLYPIQLAWQATGRDTIEVYSRRDNGKKQYCELYPLRPLLAAGLSSDEIKAAILRNTSPEAWENTRAAGVMHFDAASDHLIIRHSYTLHGEVETVLAALGQPDAGE